MKECDGEGRGCWAYAAERPGFSIVEVLFIHVLCSRRKILAVPRVPGLHIRNCADIYNNLVQMGAKVSAINVTAKELFERLHLVSGLGTFGP